MSLIFLIFNRHNLILLCLDSYIKNLIKTIFLFTDNRFKTLLNRHPILAAILTVAFMAILAVISYGIYYIVNANGDGCK